jgi:hypothetical protein
MAKVDAPERTRPLLAACQVARKAANPSTPGCCQNRLSSSATVAAVTRSGIVSSGQ